MATLFADISHHQTGVDLAAYKAAGHDRVCIKATGGATDGTLRYVDPAFADRWGRAGDLGLHRIAYHYARNNNGGDAELAWCMDRVNAAGGLSPGDVLCYDQEDTRPGGPAAALARTREFVGAAVAAGIVTGWVYSGKWYLDPAGIRATDLPVGWRQLWISDYTAGQADAAIEVPAGWARAQIVARQFTDKAAVPGVSGGCDYSRTLIEWITDTGDDMSAADVATILAAVQHCESTLYNLTRGQTPAGKPDPGHAEQAVTTVNARLTALRADVAKLTLQVGAQANDEQVILAAIVASAGTLEAKLVAAIEAAPQAPGGGVDAKAVVAELRDALTRGEQ